MVKFLSCTEGCPGQPQPAHVSRRFRHQHSQVDVVVRGIPISVCPVCGQSFVEEEIAQQLEAILASVPPVCAPLSGQIELDFAEARPKGTFPVVYQEEKSRL